VKSQKIYISNGWITKILTSSFW